MTPPQLSTEALGWEPSYFFLEAIRRFLSVHPWASVGIDFCTSNKKIWVPFLCWPKNVSWIKRSSHDLFMAIKASRWDSTTASPRISDKKSWPAFLIEFIPPGIHKILRLSVPKNTFIDLPERKSMTSPLAPR